MSVASPWDCALRYLGQRSHSQHEIGTKLARRGFTAEDIDNTIDRLQRADLIDDEQFAVEYARSLFNRKKLSSREVARRLGSKGLTAAIIQAAVEQATEADDYERALFLAEKKAGQMSGTDPVVQRRRLLAFLARRGFSKSECYAAARHVLQPGS